MQHAGDIHTFSKAQALTNIDVVFPTIIKYPKKYPPIDNMASPQMQRVGLQKLAA